MDIEGIIRAQKRTQLDLRSRQIWSYDRLCTPHLPANIDVYKPGQWQDLDTAAVADPIVPKYSKLFEKMVAVKTAPDNFCADHFSADGLYIEDMPIKTPDGKITLPHNVCFGPWARILWDMFIYEKRYNPCLDAQYLYLTIQQSQVKGGTVQRHAGLHLDGFQKATITPQVAQHQLAITNAIPTEFVAMAYDTESLPRTKKELFAELTAQSEGRARFKPFPYELHLLNAFCPHEPGYAEEDCFRTFIRFSASKIPFMGADNTRNPFLDLKWDTEAKAKFYASIAA